MLVWNNWTAGMKTVLGERSGLRVFMWLQSFAGVRDTRVISAGLAGPHCVANLHYTGLSAPFSSPSCLVVFIERAPGSHCTGMLSVSPSPPAMELLFPARVYSAFCQSLTYTNQHSNWLQNKSLERSLLQCCDVSCPDGIRNVPPWQIDTLECSWLQCPQGVTILVCLVLIFAVV